MERLGIADELRDKQESIASRLSPAARHQAFPNVYARPAPREAKKIEDPTLPFRAEIALLKEEIASVKRENGRLTILVKELSRPMAHRIEPPMQDVMAEFCFVMNESGRNVDGNPWSDIWLTTKRRIHPISHPRHVCIWLVREICLSPSLPMIGAVFGGLDHTSIIYACKKAPGIMRADSGLRQVAINVLRKFGVNPAALEQETDRESR